MNPSVSDAEDTIREVLPGIYCIKVPLSGNPLKFVNSYLVRGTDRSLLIDVGFYREECFETVKNALTTLGIDLHSVDLFFTHGHPDHCGAAPFYVQYAPTMYAGFNSFKDLFAMTIDDLSGFYSWMDYLQTSCIQQGVDTFDTFPLMDSGKVENLYRTIGVADIDYPITLVHDGDQLQIGAYTFTAVSTLGHWPDHICLYDQDKEILIAGDQIINKITPVISTFDTNTDVLHDFIHSLDKLDALSISVALSGHRTEITDVHTRIQEMKNHHDRRLAEMVELVASGKHTINQIVSNATWHSPFNNWYEWPGSQKYFSLGETIAHMVYLVNVGAVSVETVDGVPYYSLIHKADHYIKNN